MSNHDREGPQSPGQDASLKRAWQQASDELPPPELDAAIIAAARKSVQDRGAAVSSTRVSPRSPNRLTRWQPLAAAATVAGLAFILVQLLPRDRDVAPSIRMEESAPGQAAEDKEAPGAAAPTISVPEATAEAPAPATAKASRTDSTATADGATAMDSTEADQRKAVVPETAGSVASAAAAAPAAPARERSQGNAAPPSAADRAAGIAALYAAGDAAGAAAALREFRAVDPDADTYLPDSLRDWARTVE